MNRINALYSGNWSSPNIWGSSTPQLSSIIYCNGNQIEIDANANVKVGLITNDQTYTDIVGGELLITENETVLEASLQSASQPLIIFSGEGKLTIIGNVMGGIRNAHIPCIINMGSGTIEVVGDVIGGQSGFCPGIVNKSNGIVNVVGSVYCGDGSWSYGVCNEEDGKVYINNNEVTDKYIGMYFYERGVII